MLPRQHPSITKLISSQALLQPCSLYKVPNPKHNHESLNVPVWEMRWAQWPSWPVGPEGVCLPLPGTFSITLHSALRIVVRAVSPLCPDFTPSSLPSEE